MEPTNDSAELTHIGVDQHRRGSRDASLAATTRAPVLGQAGNLAISNDEVVATVTEGPTRVTDAGRDAEFGQGGADQETEPIVDTTIDMPRSGYLAIIASCTVPGPIGNAPQLRSMLHDKIGITVLYVRGVFAGRKAKHDPTISSFSRSPQGRYRPPPSLCRGTNHCPMRKCIRRKIGATSVPCKFRKVAVFFARKVGANRLKAHKQLPVLRAALLRHQQALLGDQPIAVKIWQHSACCTNFNRHRDYPLTTLGRLV